MDKLSADDYREIELELMRERRAKLVTAYVEDFTRRENNVCVCIRTALATRWRGAELLRKLTAAQDRNAATMLAWEMTGQCTQAELNRANKDHVRAWIEITEWFQRADGVHYCCAEQTA